MTGRRSTAGGIAVAVLLVGGVAMAATLGLRADRITTFSAEQAAPTTTTPAPSGTTLYLKTDGNPTTSDRGQALPLNGTAPTTTGTVADYDLDSKAGLTILKGANGLGDARKETDDTKRQRWAVAGPITVNGVARLHLSAAMADGLTSASNNAKKGAVNLFLLDCPTALTTANAGCTQVAEVEFSASPWHSAAGWATKSIDFPTASKTVTTGRFLVLQVTVDGKSDSAMWFAYDHVDHPSRLVIP